MEPIRRVGFSDRNRTDPNKNLTRTMSIQKICLALKIIILQVLFYFGLHTLPFKSHSLMLGAKNQNVRGALSFVKIFVPATVAKFGLIGTCAVTESGFHSLSPPWPFPYLLPSLFFHPWISPLFLSMSSKTLFKEKKSSQNALFSFFLLFSVLDFPAFNHLSSSIILVFFAYS